MRAILLSIFLYMSIAASAQYTAMDFNQPGCVRFSRTYHLFADLDSGKAVFLHFFMDNCTMCPPAAQTIQNMAAGINAQYPGLVIGYAFPFDNTTTCAASVAWVSNNGLSTLYTPMDSGDAAVVHYGGFGMPTVVLLGGRDHRVMYASMTFTDADTAALRDSILRMIGVQLPSAVETLPADVQVFNTYPNPASHVLNINLQLNEAADVSVDITELTGRRLTQIVERTHTGGQITRQYDCNDLPDGIYLLRASIDGKVISRKVTIIH